MKKSPGIRQRLITTFESAWKIKMWMQFPSQRPITGMGNTGVHRIDVARWGMNKRIHPVKVHCAGGLYVWDSDQETPNVQTAIVEYADGSCMDIEVTNL